MRVLKIIVFTASPILIFSSTVFSQTEIARREDDTLAFNVLIPASATMVRAWEVPRDPFRDSLTGNSATRQSIRNGYELFTKTSQVLPYAACNTVACGNCHLNSGQRERALPLVGVAVKYPEFSKRAGRELTLRDRIIDCLRRSIDAHPDGDTTDQLATADLQITNNSTEVVDLASYLAWLSEGYAKQQSIPWRGQNSISPANLLPVDQIDTAAGR